MPGNGSTPNPPRPSTAKHNGNHWVDGNGNPITGDCPLAQLGVNGQWQHPIDGKTYTIQSIDTTDDGHVVIHSTSAG